MKNVLLTVLICLLCSPDLLGQCKGLGKKTDKFKDEVRVWTPILEPASVIKHIESDTTFYFLNLMAPASVNADRKGVKVMLDNGQRLEWPEEKVKIDVSRMPRFNSNVRARSFLALTAEQLDLLTKHKIADYQLYIYEWSVKEKLGETLRQQINCLVTVNQAEIKEQ